MIYFYVGTRNENVMLVFTKMMLKIIYVCIVFLSSGLAIEWSKHDQGISKGFLSDCPGSLKPAIIKPESLKKLSISLLSSGNLLDANLTKYNYYNIRKLAKHPEMDFNKKTMMYLGGYLEPVFPGGKAIGSLYKELGYNVLILDYFIFTLNHFPVAARMIRPVAKHVAEMLVELTELGLDPKKLELVGFSLGTHTMGLISKNYRQVIGQNISSLVALDPSGPCFRYLSSDLRLDRSDADFVLTIHTNIDGFGTAVPIGHVSIFVNGGEFQPGDIWLAPCLLACSHSRAYMLWLSALINPGIFVAIQCDSVQQARNDECYDRSPKVTNNMDIYIDRNKPGIYYLRTHNRYPYGLGGDGLKKNKNLYKSYLNWLNKDDVLVM